MLILMIRIVVFDGLYISFLGGTNKGSQVTFSTCCKRQFKFKLRMDI